MPGGVDEHVEPQVQQRIDGVHRRVAVERVAEDNDIHFIRQAAGREPARPDVEDHQHQQAEHESRKGIPQDTEDARHLIDSIVVVHRRQHPQPHASEDDRGHRPQRQLERGREAALDHIDHFQVGCLRITEVAAQDPARDLAAGGILSSDQPVPVLHRQRIIETVFDNEGVDRLVGLGDVTYEKCGAFYRGKELQHGKNEEGNPKNE